MKDELKTTLTIVGSAAVAWGSGSFSGDQAARDEIKEQAKVEFQVEQNKKDIERVDETLVLTISQFQGTLNTLINKDD